jgi:CheY-like chemotaxis protein
MDSKKARRHRVLVLDDNSVDALVAQRFLEHNGYDVVVCRSVWEAAGFLERNLVDVLVTDQVLGRDSFHELHNMMTCFGQKNPPYKKVVVMSATWTNGDRRRFGRYGELVSELVTKAERVGPYQDAAVSELALVAAVRTAVASLELEHSNA